MADWPDTAELAQVVNLAPDEAVEAWQTTLDRVLASAIDTVKGVRGDWDEDVDEPDDKLANAALTMAVLMWASPNADKSSLIRDATFQTLMFGRRRRFGIA